MSQETLHRLIKHRFRMKYALLFLILMLYVPLIGMMITQFIFRNSFQVFFIWFIFQLAVAIILNIRLERKYALPVLDSEDIIYKYLCYFKKFKRDQQYLEYTEVITWFYRKVQAAYTEKKDTYTDTDKIINNLHSALRPQDNRTTCYAIRHMEGFKTIVNTIISDYEVSHKLKELTYEQIESFRSEKEEKHFVVSWIHDKNILTYLLVLVVHIFGCFLLACSEEKILWLTFWGNICLCIPMDIVVILLYCGIVKDNK